MTTDKFKELLVKLTEHTVNRDVVWEKTSDEVQFQTVLGKYTLRLLETSSDAVEPDYVLRILDQEGAIIEAFSDRDIHRDDPSFLAFRIMSELYQMARRSAMGADRAIDAIIKDLDNMPLF